MKPLLPASYSKRCNRGPGVNVYSIGCVYLGLAKYREIGVTFLTGGEGGVSEKRHNDVSRSKYRYVTLPLYPGAIYNKLHYF